jgi:hypothetical protein
MSVVLLQNALGRFCNAGIGIACASNMKSPLREITHQDETRSSTTEMDPEERYAHESQRFSKN